MSRPISTTDTLRAQTLNRAGLEHYERWEMETAITLFQEAIRLDNQIPEYYLNLARAHVRMGDYELMLQALGDYLHIEQDIILVNRFQTLFSNALDSVEELLTTIMRDQKVRLEIIGAAIQMWLEYRVTIGKRYLDLKHPQAWASALDYTVRKVNFEEVSLETITEWYKTDEIAVQTNQAQLVETLDIMPCDYRYFRGKDNPLDKLVEAATMLEELENRFRAIG
ncbi:tetratricopeptide repeat protein [Anaerolineales bacterium HSG24]|nr:tetratricopeptide repeat protein [Anaerolineales bacterium HSG24]